MRNKMTLKEFILNSLVYYVIGTIIYDALLFRMGEHTGGLELALGMLLIQGGVYSFNFLVSAKWDKNRESIITTMLVGFTVCLFSLYSDYYPKVCLFIGILAGIVIFLHTLFVFGRRIPLGKIGYIDRVFKQRVRRSYVGLRNIIAGAGIVLVVLVIAQAHFGWGQVSSTSKLQEAEIKDADEYFIDNIDVFLKLQPEQWEKLDNQQKIDVLQVVLNYESRMIGLEKHMNISAKKLRDGVMGHCIYERSMIQIDIEHLGDTPESVYNTVAHEVCHAAQHQYKDIYDSLTPSQQQLIYFRDAAIYSYELENYINTEKGDYYGYYSQRIESEARTRGIIAYHQMILRLEEYLESSEVTAE